MELEEKWLNFEEKQGKREEWQHQEERQFQIQMKHRMMVHASAPPGRLHVGEPTHTLYGSIDTYTPFPDNN